MKRILLKILWLGVIFGLSIFIAMPIYNELFKTITIIDYPKGYPAELQDMVFLNDPFGRTNDRMWYINPQFYFAVTLTITYIVATIITKIIYFASKLFKYVMGDKFKAWQKKR